MLRLVFVNTGNTCYMNSFCAATLWALILESGERDFHMGRLNIAFHALLKQHSNRVVVTGLVPWRLALKDWSQPHIQYDVTAFAYHILAQAAAASFDGAWEARVLEPGCVEWWMVVFFTFLFHWSSRTQARCNKEFWIGTNRHSHMHYVGRLVSFAYVSAGLAIEMDMYEKFKLPRC